MQYLHSTTSRWITKHNTTLHHTTQHILDSADSSVVEASDVDIYADLDLNLCVNIPNDMVALRLGTHTGHTVETTHYSSSDITLDLIS